MSSRGSCRGRGGAGRYLAGCALAVLVALTPAAGGAGAQSSGEAARLLQEMTPAERIGQLFLVSFPGSRLEAESGIAALIRDGHIGGVVLDWENGNFVGPPDSVPALRTLVTDLQSANEASIRLATPSAGAAGANEGTSPYVPLFIGVKQDKSDGPIALAIPGLSELPSPMALGATWDVEAARATGRVLGRELAALGINLYLGPSLDVLESPDVANSEWLGARAFGGDPYWVGQMGASYVAGLHDGAGGRLAVVATHFPGVGNSDRPPVEEVASVRKSIDDLAQIELVPFFAAMTALPGASQAVDGVLSSHIRYQGFEGNIRATTRPVSLDREAYDQLMALEPLKAWRAAGGVSVSDSLGSQAIRTFVDPNGTDFRGHIVARDAFQAGNDLLYLSNFGTGDDEDGIAAVRDTLSFFEGKYSEDPVFADRVDEAVTRILGLKLRLYGGNFRLSSTFPLLGASVGNDRTVAIAVAGRSATLISPALDDVRNRLGPPQAGQRIVIFTDTRPYRLCRTCESGSALGEQALADTILALYGPRAAGQVQSWSVRSFSMGDLEYFLGGTPPHTPAAPLADLDKVDDAVREADWLVFNALPQAPLVFGSNGLRMLLDTRPDLVRDKRLVVFAFGAPLGLDATDTSKLDAYYALYSDSSAFVEMAARLLFQEEPAFGASPVGIPGIGYDLIEALSPNPTQVLDLSVRKAIGGTATPTEPGYRIGDVITLSTGTILDRNGNAVPDGTPVEFDLSYAGENLSAALRSTTVGGVGEASLALDRVGLLSARAESGDAKTSTILQLNVQEDAPAFVTVIAPTAIPTGTPMGGGVEATPTAEAGGGEASAAEQGGSASSLFWAIVMIGATAAAGYGLVRWRGGRVMDRRRAALAAATGGLAAYDVAAILSSRLPPGGGGQGVLILAAAAGGCLGAGVWYLVWKKSLEPPATED